MNFTLQLRLISINEIHVTAVDRLTKPQLPMCKVIMISFYVRTKKSKKTTKHNLVLQETLKGKNKNELACELHTCSDSGGA